MVDTCIRKGRPMVNTGEVMDDDLKEKYIEAAREEWEGDEVQIDGNAEVSDAQNGAWVAAWVYVHHTATEK